MPILLSILNNHKVLLFKIILSIILTISFLGYINYKNNQVIDLQNQIANITVDKTNLINQNNKLKEYNLNYTKQIENLNTVISDNNKIIFDINKDRELLAIKSNQLLDKINTSKDSRLKPYNLNLPICTESNLFLSLEQTNILKEIDTNIRSMNSKIGEIHESIN